MIDRVELHDFRCHANTSVPLTPLTVIVGPNGSGKTSILQGLHFASQMCRRRFYDVFNGPRHPEALVRARGDGFSIRLGGCNPPWSMVLDAFRVNDGPDVPSWSATIKSDWDGVTTEPVNADHTDPRTGHFGTPKEISERISSAVFLRLDARRVAEPARMNPNARVEFDGSGLAAVLATVALEEPDLLQKIQGDLRLLVPSFRRVRVNQARRRNDQNFDQDFFSLSFDFASGSNIAAESVSEGTLLGLTLVTLLDFPRIRPRLILLDDLEQSLHPRAQWQLIALLRAAIEGSPGLQVVATTHSPYLVDELQPEEVIVCMPAPDGTARCAPLSAHPKAKDFQGVLSTGEFLSAEGEDWVPEEVGA